MEMKSNNMDAEEFSVNESAFWHTNMDLYYGYQTGEVVEVEHECNKYWLATIEYSLRHLVLLKWVGDYGEFWIDTSVQNSLIGPGNLLNELNMPKRLYPLGHHLQSQLKSQFSLERPIRVLEKPSLYNPANDPYADIKTVEDLLAYEVENSHDTFGDQTLGVTNEAANLVIAKCRTKVDYCQEDQDELEAALQNLNGIDDASVEGCENVDERLETQNSGSDENSQELLEPDRSVTIPLDTKPSVQAILQEKTSPEENSQPVPKSDSTQCETLEVDHQKWLNFCRELQDSAIAKGRYHGFGKKHQKKVFYMKPKQFYDLGGANQERVIVPGTLLEVCHTMESSDGLELCHWFAVVLKNVGGRLSLRWFYCDEPKFKQGRLELKSLKSELILEEEESSADPDGEQAYDQSPSSKIPARQVTFCMHFCNPCIHTISHARTLDRAYKLPTRMRQSIERERSFDSLSSIEHAQMDHIFDPRRMNLDKDRPIIDHLLSNVRRSTPQYLKMIFAPKDNNNPREILLSTPKTTKLLRGFVKRELGSGVFEVHSLPLPDTGEVIKFIYPYANSYTVLPLSWANKNEDCLSMHPSRNPTPVFGEKAPSDTEISVKVEASEARPETIESSADRDTRLTTQYPARRSSFTLMCEIVKTNSTDDSGNYDEFHPSYWSRLNRSQELEAPEFFCQLDETAIDTTLSKFRVMDQLEVVHPSSDTTLCLGRIRKVVFPLLWIQISSDSYTLLPFNSTDIYPSKWCESNNHQLISLLPPRKRTVLYSQPIVRKRVKLGDVPELGGDDISHNEDEQLDLDSLNDKHLDLDYILNEKSNYIRIYFNHKCFTGPSLSKGKICSLPQYVGPGPLRLVMEEVITKIISVAYVPPRILNDLSSKTFEDLLTTRGLTNPTPIEFKAKYQKRVHRENIPVCLDPDCVTLYCECVCEHLKCCYNLFGPNLYDGDDCPGHCRALTKSNKFMKRATYYREKARLGEFLNNDNGTSKKSSSNGSKTSRARYAGRGSAESTSSSLSRSDQIHSRASSTGDGPTNELRENLLAVEEMDNEDLKDEGVGTDNSGESLCQPEENASSNGTFSSQNLYSNLEKIISSIECNNEMESNLNRKPMLTSPMESEFSAFQSQGIHPEEWTTEDVAEYLEMCELGKFKRYMMAEGVDGHALLLLDKNVIKEHFQPIQCPQYSPEDVGKLGRFIEFLKSRVESA